MLGLTSALSSSSEKEQYYALSFDGTDDYVDLGPSNGIMTASQDPISFSCWVKTTLTSQGYIFSCQRSNGGSAFSVKIAANGIASGVIWNGVSAHTFPESTTAVNDGNWHHVAIVAKNGNQKIYVDGALEDTHTSTMDVIPSADHCAIGAHTAGATYRYNGSLTGLAVYTVELDANAVASIYNAGRHHNLNTPIGNYSSTPSHYYVLGHGLFDDKVNGVVHDQANPGFGSELVFNGDFEELGDDLAINGTFDTSIAIGTTGSGWTLSSGTAEYFNGGIKVFDEVANDARLRMRTQTHSQVTIEAEETYKIQYEIKDFQGDLSYAAFSIYTAGTSHTIPSAKKQVGTHTVYLESGSNTNGILQFQVSNSMNGFVVFDNISVQKVDPNDYWNLTIGNPTIEEGVAIFPDSTSSYFIQVNVADLSAENYKLTYEVVSTNGNNFRLAGGNSAFGTVTLDSATIGKKTVYLTSNGNQKSLQFNNNAFIGSFTNVSVKKLNDSSGLVTGATFVADN